MVNLSSFDIVCTSKGTRTDIAYKFTKNTI